MYYALDVIIKHSIIPMKKISQVSPATSQSHLVHILPELHELSHLQTAQLLKEPGAAHFFWRFPARHGGIPIAGWFMRENPAQKWMILGYPH